MSWEVGELLQEQLRPETSEDGEMRGHQIIAARRQPDFKLAVQAYKGSQSYMWISIANYLRTSDFSWRFVLQTSASQLLLHFRLQLANVKSTSWQTG